MAAARLEEVAKRFKPKSSVAAVRFGTRGWTTTLWGIQFEYASEDEALAKAVELVVKGYAREIAR